MSLINRQSICFLPTLLALLLPANAAVLAENIDTDIAVKYVSVDLEASVESRLANAAEAQKWEQVVELAKSGLQINAPQPDGMTALHWAVYWQQASVVQELIDAGADVNHATRYKITPLMIAAQQGHAGMTRTLIDSGAEVDAKQSGGETLLMTAARADSAEVTQQLIEAGADVNATERRGQTALMWAAAAGNSKAVDVLLASKADPTVRAHSGFTALTLAAREGQTTACQRLIAAGVDVNQPLKSKAWGGRHARSGMAPLLFAVESGHFELAIELVRAGADPNDQRSGFAPLHAVTWVRKPGRGDNPAGDPAPVGSGSMTSLQFVEAMVSAGAEVNLALTSGKGGRAKFNPKGATPFLLASRTADLQLMQLLLDLGAESDVTNSEGCTPLMVSAGVGVQAVGEEAGTEPEVLEAVALLLELGAEVNAVDENRETPMHGAAYRNFPRVVDLLAANGADPAAWGHKNKAGWTPELIAQGFRPGSLKPSPETLAALKRAKNTKAAVLPVADD